MMYENIKIWSFAHIIISIMISLSLGSCGEQKPTKADWVDNDWAVSQNYYIFVKMCKTGYADTITIFAQPRELYAFFYNDGIEFYGIEDTKQKEKFYITLGKKLQKGSPILVPDSIYDWFSCIDAKVDPEKVLIHQSKSLDEIVSYIVHYPAYYYWNEDRSDFVAAAYVCWINNIYIMRDDDFIMDKGSIWFATYGR